MLKEYVRFLPYGLTIAGSFLYSIHAPVDFYIADSSTITANEVIRDAYARGGKAVDFELCALVVDMFRLHQKLNMTLAVM